MCGGWRQILGRDWTRDLPNGAPIAHEPAEVKPCNGSMQRALASKLPSHFAKRGRHGAAAPRVKVALWMEFGMSTHIVDDLIADLVVLRRDLHAHPELAFEERRTAGIVAASLRLMGLEVHEGLAGTGVVGTLRHGGSASRRYCLPHGPFFMPLTGCRQNLFGDMFV